MRNMIFLILALLATTSLFAQKFEIGVNGGIGYNTAPSIDKSSFSSPITSNEKPSSLSLATSIKALYNYHKWQLGIEADFMNLSYRYAVTEYYFINGQLVEMYSPSHLNTSFIANPAI